MRTKVISLAAMAMLPAAVSADAHGGQEPMSVADVIARHHELDGRMVEVRGWLSVCQRLSCSLVARLNDDDAPYISIGESRSFDARVRGRIGQRITVRARLDARCLHGRADTDDGVIAVCTDRASELRNPVLIERHH